MTSYRVTFFCHLIDSENEYFDTIEYDSLEELLEDWPTAIFDHKFDPRQCEVYV
jgi:hypothetical protein